MSAKQQKEVKLEFKISNIELFNKSFAVPAILPQNKFPEVQFDLAINVHVDKENKRIVSILQVKMKAENSNDIVAGITVGCTFDIVNFEELVINNGDSASVPETIIETLNIITIGTTRGIMFNEFKGTWLHNTILPVIDPKSFTQNKEKKGEG
jgi:hypothetical protein